MIANKVENTLVIEGEGQDVDQRNYQVIIPQCNVDNHHTASLLTLASTWVMIREIGNAFFGNE